MNSTTGWWLSTLYLRWAALFDVVTDQSEKVAKWAGDKFGLSFVDPYWAIGIVRNNELVGAAILNGFEASNIELSAVGAGAFSKSVCRILAKTIFVANSCERVTVRVRADNEYVLRVALKFGWKKEGVLRRYYGDTDCVILGMLKSECRFLR